MSDLREMRVNTLRSYPLLSRAGSRPASPASPAAVGETQKSLFMHLHKATLPSTVFLSMLTAIALVGCSEASQAPPAPQAPEVSVVTVHRASVPVTTELPGRTSPHLVAQVRARVDGIVLSRPFTEGADVNASQLLYQIDPAPYRAALASAEAMLARAQATLAAATASPSRTTTTRSRPRGRRPPMSPPERPRSRPRKSISATRVWCRPSKDASAL